MFGFLFRLVGRVIGFAVKAAVVVAALAVVAAATMYALFDGESYKRVVAQRVVDVTGRTLSIDGPVELQLTFPPSVVLHGARLSNAPWGTRRDMARVRRVQIQANPLSGAAEVRLDGVDVMLETNANGVGNWEFALTGTAGVTTVVALDALGLLGSIVPAKVPTVLFSDATVGFRDGATGRAQTAVLGSPGLIGLAAGGGADGSMLVAAVTDKQPDPCEKEGSSKLR